jgi:hypothetical protein
VIDPENYCREIEAYLCRKNDGHLIRIVGPAFEQVSRWAREGIPIKVAYAGIDRYFERYYRKGPRRRPVRIEFCEADVLDAFDDWRRAVGVALPAAGPSGDLSGKSVTPATRHRASLSAHIDGVIARLTAVRAQHNGAVLLQDAIKRIAEQLAVAQPRAKRLRGEARDRFLADLAALDAMLISSALASLDDKARAAAEAHANTELRPFRDRMAPDAYRRACVAALERHVRAEYDLPTITFG